MESASNLDQGEAWTLSWLPSLNTIWETEFCVWFPRIIQVFYGWFSHPVLSRSKLEGYPVKTEDLSRKKKGKRV